jgi:hypothetical protein
MPVRIKMNPADRADRLVIRELLVKIDRFRYFQERLLIVDWSEARVSGPRL